jgi:hypothetical protein
MKSAQPGQPQSGIFLAIGRSAAAGLTSARVNEYQKRLLGQSFRLTFTQFTPPYAFYPRLPAILLFTILRNA